MSRASMMMMMPMSVKSVAVLLLAMACCCVCEPQAYADCGGPSSSCSSLCLCSLPKDVAMVVEKLKTLESRLEENQRVVGVLRGQPRVAFSAALRDSGGGNVGPFSVATPLKYKRVFSNTGSSYNPSTGTALTKELLRRCDVEVTAIPSASGGTPSASGGTPSAPGVPPTPEPQAAGTGSKTHKTWFSFKILKRRSKNRVSPSGAIPPDTNQSNSADAAVPVQKPRQRSLFIRLFTSCFKGSEES